MTSLVSPRYSIGPEQFGVIPAYNLADELVAAAFEEQDKSWSVHDSRYKHEICMAVKADAVAMLHVVAGELTS